MGADCEPALSLGYTTAALAFPMAPPLVAVTVTLFGEGKLAGA